MGFVDKNNDDVRLTLTDYGKSKFLNEGYRDTFKYFSLSDDGVIYWLDISPEGVLDITGSHKASTFKVNDKYKITI